MVRTTREDLLKVLAYVQPGLSTRGTVSQSTCVVFQGGWAVSFNEDICCRTRTHYPDEFEGAVQSGPLKEYLEAATDEDLELSMNGRECKIKAGRKRAGIRMEREILLPLEHVECPESWSDLPDDFVNAVEQVTPSAGTNTQEYITTCVHLTESWIEATDRVQQMTRYDLRTGVDRPFLVPAKSLAHIPSLGVSRIGVTENWLHVRNKGVIFSCRRHLEPFPDVTRAYEEFRGTRAVLPRGADEAAKIAGIFPDDKESEKVQVRLSDGKMRVRGEGFQGWAEIELDMSYRGEDRSFLIAPKLLVRLVQTHSECEVGAGRLMIRGDSWRHLIWLSQPREEIVGIEDSGEDEVSEQD